MRACVRACVCVWGGGGGGVCGGGVGGGSAPLLLRTLLELFTGKQLVLDLKFFPFDVVLSLITLTFYVLFASTWKGSFSQTADIFLGLL